MRKVLPVAIALGLTAAAAVTAAAVTAAAPPEPAACERLASLALPDGTVTMAQLVDAGAFTPPAGGRGPMGAGRAGAGRFAALPAFCRVAATLTPTSDSDIKIEVWLPASGWNGKFQAVGNGGWAGTISYAAMAEALKRGYATSVDRHRPRRRRRQLRARPSGEAHRLRLPLRARDDRQGEGDRRSPTTAARRNGLVLERLLDRRTAGARRSAALPGRLRRHHRGRVGEPAHVSQCVAALDRAGDAEGPGELHPAGEVPGDPSGRPRRVRCARRREGRAHRPTRRAAGSIRSRSNAAATRACRV